MAVVAIMFEKRSCVLNHNGAEVGELFILGGNRKIALNGLSVSRAMN